MLDTPFYIACLRLKGRRCVVVGGGEIGLEKVEGLLACDGDVTLIAPEARSRAAAARRRGLDRAGSSASTPARGPRGRRSSSSPATDDTDINIRIYEDAERRAMLVNVVDVPPLCNFILPAIVRTGPAGHRDLHRRRLAGAGQAHEGARSPSCSARSTRSWRSCSTTRAAGRRARCRPTRTARRSSRASSTASPTRSSCCAHGDEQAVRDLIAAAQRTAAPA